MASTILVLLFVLVFYVSVFSRTTNAPSSMAIDQLCNNIAVKIGSAVQFGDGFSQNITLPPDLQGISYNVTVYGSSVICRSSVQDIVKSHIAKTITNGTSGPPFTLAKRTLSIRNNLGTVVIS